MDLEIVPDSGPLKTRKEIVTPESVWEDRFAGTNFSKMSAVNDSGLYETPPAW